MNELQPFFESLGLLWYYNFLVSPLGIVLGIIGFIAAMAYMKFLTYSDMDEFGMLVGSFYPILYPITMPVYLLVLILILCLKIRAYIYGYKRGGYTVKRVGILGNKKYIVEYNGNVITSYYPEVKFLHDTAEGAKTRMETAKRLGLTGNIQDSIQNGDPELITKLKLDPDFLTSHMQKETICNDRSGLSIYSNSRNYITNLIKKYHNLTIK